MGNTAKIRHRRASARRKTARRWFTARELYESGLIRSVRIIAGDAEKDLYFVDARSAEQIRARIAAKGAV